MRFERLLGAVVLFVMGNAACTITIGDYDPPPKPVSNWTVESARGFKEFDLYWLGQSNEGLELTYVGRTTDGDGVHHASFWYGEPTYAGGASGSWNPPLEIDIQPYCGFSPEEFLSYQDDDYGVESEITNVQIRGVDGYLESYSSNQDSLFLWSGSSTIHLYTYQSELDIQQAARKLIGLSPHAAARDEPLPVVTSTEC